MAQIKLAAELEMVDWPMPYAMKKALGNSYLLLDMNKKQSKSVSDLTISFEMRITNHLVNIHIRSEILILPES